MKKYYLLIFFSVLYPQNTDLDSLNYTYNEIREQLYLWQAEFGTTGHPSSYYENSIVYHLDSIGVSSNDNLPIYAVKLSLNANQNEDETKVLILGQCHAEEIFGVAMSMAFIDWLLHPAAHTVWLNDFLPFMYNLEIWVVPTHNPEGLNVVHGYEDENGVWQQDITYRKNKTDVNENGIFDYTPFFPDQIAGNDSDGVDLNRNYGLNWFLGDDKYELNLQSCPSNQTYSSNYDYYRGLEKFSEKEIQSIRDFVIDKQFLLSIAYHSSRSGCVSERVIYPWGWADNSVDSVKMSPDYNVIEEIAENLANNIRKESSSQSYIPRAQKSRTGNAHDWIYSETGCIQFLIEMGTSNIQPMDQSIIDDTIERNREGLFYLLHEASGTGPDTRHLTGIISEYMSGVLLDSVEVRILELHSQVLKPRLTDSFGRFHRLIPLGYYTLEFIKEGYEGKIINNVSINSGQSETLDIELIPLQQHNVTFICEACQEFSENVMIELIDTNGYQNTFNIFDAPINKTLYHQEYALLAFGDSISPYSSILSITSSDTVYLNLESKNLISGNLVQNNTWLSDGMWQIRDGELISQDAELYPSGSNFTTKLENILQVDVDQIVAIEMNLAYELEWEKDTAYFNIISGDTLIQVTQWTNQNWVVHPEFYFIELQGGVSYGLELGIKSDETLGYRGVKIHNIYFYGPSADLANDENIIPQSYVLHQNYPNPFNLNTSIGFYLPYSAKVLLQIYDIRGRLVHTLLNNTFYSAGYHEYSLQSPHLDLSTGIYVYKLDTHKWKDSRKMLILK